MNNKDFWDSVNAIIAEGITPEGLQKLDEFAEQFVRHPHQHTRTALRWRAGTDDGGAVPKIIGAARPFGSGKKYKHCCGKT